MVGPGSAIARGPHMKHLVGIVVGCMVAGCVAAPIEPPPPTTAFTPVALDEFPGAAKVLRGFDERTTASDWIPHDQALFGLRLDKGGDTTRWMLHLEALRDVPVSAVEPDSSSTKADGSVTVEMQSLRADVVVKVMQPDGTPLNETRVRLPASYLAKGLLPAIRAGSK